MHTEDLENTIQFTSKGFHSKGAWFVDGGISPSGECWVSPTDIFLRMWEGPAGILLKKQGFRLRDDGKQIGASQDRILICPRHKN